MKSNLIILNTSLELHLFDLQNANLPQQRINTLGSRKKASFTFDISSFHGKRAIVRRMSQREIKRKQEGGMQIRAWTIEKKTKDDVWLADRRQEKKNSPLTEMRNKGGLLVTGAR